MKEKICSAVELGSSLQFEYNGHKRVVKPFKLFRAKDGTVLFEGVQVGGTSESGSMPFWRTFNIDKLTSVEVTDGPESVHGSDKIMPDTEEKYNQNDKRYDEIICSREDTD